MRRPLALLKWRSPFEAQLRAGTGAARPAAAEGWIDSNDRNYALDGLRGLGLLVIMAHHVVVHARAHAEGALQRLVATLAYEVWPVIELIFVLSGFLITRVLLRAKGRPRYFRNFYARRVLRIFPLYYLFIVAIFVVLPRVLPNDAEVATFPARQRWFWLYAPNFEMFARNRWISELTNHAWSLGIEEQFYLLWPVVVFLAIPRWLPVGCLVVAALSLSVRFLLNDAGKGMAAIIAFTPAHLDGLMMGASLAVMHHLRMALAWWRWLAIGCLIFALAARAALTCAGVPHEAMTNVYLTSVASIFFTGCLAASLGWPKTSLWNRLIESRALVFVGTYSYGLYLIHQPVFVGTGALLSRVTSSAPAAWLGVALIGGAVSTALAVLVHHAYERPFLRFKRYFDGPRPHPAR